MFCISLCVTGRELTDTEGEMAFFSAGPWLILWSQWSLITKEEELIMISNRFLQDMPFIQLKKIKIHVLLHCSLSSLVSALQFCALQTDIAAGCVQFVTWRKSNNWSCATMTKTALNSVKKANMSSRYLKLLQILFVPYCHRHHFMQPSTQFIQATKIKLNPHEVYSAVWG